MKILKYILLLSVMLSAMACESVDSQRIPALNVNIDLSNAGLWNTYGVSGYGTVSYTHLTLPTKRIV